jgi:hypothetical protein
MSNCKRRALYLLTAAILAVASLGQSYAAQNTRPPTKAPTGADCQAIATAAAEKVKANGGTAAQQQQAYSQAKMKCQGRM